MRLRPPSPVVLVLLASLLALPVPRPAGAADTMKKQPYLIYPGNPTQMEVLWQLSATATSTIDWGTDTGYGLGSASSPEYGSDHQHAYTITGLAPATKYYYRVTTDTYAYTGSFVSAPAASAAQLKFIAYGDTRTNPTTHDQVAAAINAVYAADPAYQTFTLQMGDYAYYGNNETYWTNEFFSPTFTNIRALMANLAYQGAMGNHENSSPVLYTKYFPYPFVAAPARYWSFDYGPIHVAVVDQYSSYQSGTAQYQWLQNDLATSNKVWKFVLLHEPGWSSGSGHANNNTEQTYIEPLCEQYGVSIVFAGHNHNYCRAVVNGVRQITTGGGGAPLESPLAGQPNVVVSSMVNHYCKIAIDHGVLSFKAFTPAGALVDSFTIVRTWPDQVPPVAGLTSPVGGETWKAGSSHPITWTATDDVGVTGVDLAYSTDGGASFSHPIASGIANSGSYAWTVPDLDGANLRVRVAAHDAAGNLGRDSSAADFTVDHWIVTASAGPGGGIVPSGAVPVLEGASRHFSIAPAPGNAVAALTVDGGPVAPDTTYTFTGVAANHTINATFSDATAPLVHVTAPAGGERWDLNSLQTITWTATDDGGVDSVDVDLSISGPTGPWQPIAHGITNSGSLPWSVPTPASDNAFVRVTAFDHALNQGSSTSDSLFHIVDPTAGVTSGPAVLALARPQPNPGPGSSTLRFSLPAAGRARLDIVDLSGRRLWHQDAEMGPGWHSVRWTGTNDAGGRVGAGLYFVRLTTPWGTRSERLALLQ